MRKIVSEYIETENLIIRNAAEQDIAALQSVCEGWSDKEYLEGNAFESEYVQKCIREGDLPPVKDATRENYRFMAVCLKKEMKIVGLIELYHGYPEQDTLWISMFLIKSDRQLHGFGREVIGAVSAEAQKKDYANIGIKVHLKNWKGLRFWSRNGFDKIVGISGDEQYGPDKFSLIGLRKSL